MNPPPSVHIQPSSPRFPLTSAAPTASGTDQRKVVIAVDLSEESAFAVQWAVQNYLRPGDSVVLLHVCPTSVLYGVDWGSVDPNLPNDAASSSESRQKLEDDFDAFTTTKAADLAQPLVEAQIPFKIHIVKDHDMKERLCLEVEVSGSASSLWAAAASARPSETPRWAGSAASPITAPPLCLPSCGGEVSG